MNTNTNPAASYPSYGQPDVAAEPVRVRIPADLDTPDRVAFGLTVRQLAVVAAFAAPAYLAWKTLAGRVPLAALAAGTAPLAALALALALGRRDGLSLDAWLLAAIAYRRRPRRLSPSGQDDTRPGRRRGSRRGSSSGAAPADGGLPSWAPEQNQSRASRRGLRRKPPSGVPGGARLGVLRLPVSAIGRDGSILTSPSHGSPGSFGTGFGTGRGRASAWRDGRAGPAGGGAVVLVAARTLTAGLHTPAEQAGLLAGYGRWLNQLSGPAQVVISSRPVDLPSRALRIAQAAAGLPHPALGRAAIDHAEHLLDLCEDGEPRARTVVIACTAALTDNPASARSTGRSAGSARSGTASHWAGAAAGAAAEAMRRAERTAAALSGLGAECRILDGGQVAGVLAAALDPFGPAGTWPRALPAEPITAATNATGIGIGVARAGGTGSSTGSSTGDRR